MTIGYSKRRLSLFVVVMNVVNFEWVPTENRNKIIHFLTNFVHFIIMNLNFRLMYFQEPEKNFEKMVYYRNASNNI